MPSGPRKSLPRHHASTPGTSCVDRRQHFPSASTKMPLSVDKNHLRAPNFHAGHPVRGQAATFPSPRPQKCPRLWTKTTSRHRTSTKSTLCVDRRQHFPSASTKDTLFVDKSPLWAPNFHKKHPLRGQAATFPSPRPQKCPRLWTETTSRHRTSTKSCSNVDRRPKIDQNCSQKGYKSLCHKKNYNYL